MTYAGAMVGTGIVVLLMGVAMVLVSANWPTRRWRGVVVGLCFAGLGLWLILAAGWHP